MADEKLFSPDTLQDDYHAAFKWAVHRGYYTRPAETRLMTLRKQYPDVYTQLAIMAHEGKWKHGNSYMFRCAVIILFSLLGHQSMTDENPND